MKCSPTFAVCFVPIEVRTVLYQFLEKPEISMSSSIHENVHVIERVNLIVNFRTTIDQLSEAATF